VKGKNIKMRKKLVVITGSLLMIIIISILLISMYFRNDYILDYNIEDRFVTTGLVDIKTIDNTIKVDLVNSNKRKNYFRTNFYGDLEKCYLQEEVAIKLRKAQNILKNKHPNYCLLVLDGARPRSVSRAMYNQLEGTPLQRYVANPEYGSMHNYGAAVDVTIVDENGIELDMGIHPFRKNLFQLGVVLVRYKFGEELNEEQEKNRKLLKDTMTVAGFNPIKLEWWHFNGFEKAEIRNRYDIIE